MPRLPFGNHLLCSLIALSFSLVIHLLFIPDDPERVHTSPFRDACKAAFADPSSAAPQDYSAVPRGRGTVPWGRGTVPQHAASVTKLQNNFYP
jgi:hypothetical protein